MGTPLGIEIPVLASADVAGDLVILVAAAVAGGYLAGLLRQPLVVGFIVGGMVIGPVTGVVDSIEDVEFIGELGVALLLFTIGLEFPLRQFRALGVRVLVAATIQISFIGAVGYVIAVSLGFSAVAATPIAAAVALSSTALLVRLLGQQGSRRDAHGQWALGIALVQDLVAVPVLVVLPQLGASTGGALVEDVLIATAKGIAMVAVVLVVGRFLVPWILGQALANRSRELFLMSVFALASGIALGSFAAGLSVAFGAFLAGVVTAQSIYATRALQEVVPLRDLFAATFFVSIGVLFDFHVVVEHWPIFVSVLLWGGLGKVRADLRPGALVRLRRHPRAAHRPAAGPGGRVLLPLRGGDAGRRDGGGGRHPDRDGRRQHGDLRGDDRADRSHRARPAPHPRAGRPLDLRAGGGGGRRRAAAAHRHRRLRALRRRGRPRADAARLLLPRHRLRPRPAPSRRGGGRALHLGRPGQHRDHGRGRPRPRAHAGPDDRRQRRQ